ncbi:MAG TPA: hypothetical protein VL201_02565 [Patescibacteria group bacterium]|nr:hypothetical protein [Patescibacteria group bacterium]
MKGLFYRAYCVNRYAFLLFVFLYSMHVLTLRLMHVNKVVATISGGSNYLVMHVKNYVESIHFYTAYSILKAAVTKFPWLSNVSIVRTVDRTMYCDATIKNIAYYVNNAQVITDDGKIFPDIYFDSFLLKKAKKCSIKNDFLEKYVDQIVAFLNQIPEDAFFLYHIVIENEYDVRLYPILTTEYYIKLTLDIFFEPKIVHEAIAQISYIKKHYSSLYKNNQCIIIDMRFKDQIVFTKEYKGTV